MCALLPACAAPGGNGDDTADRPSRALAGRPGSLPPSLPGLSPRPSVSAEPTSAAAGSTAPAPGSRPGGTSASASATATAAPGRSEPAETFRPAGSVTDRQRDYEGDAPAYADLVAVFVESGPRSVRVTIEMAGALPSRLPAEETLGAGVDFYARATQTESDYQLYVDGQPDGWYAYLHTPRGFVRYPGTFALGDRRLVFVVPWSSLGNPSSGRFNAFADFSRARTGGNEAGEDHAPDLLNAPWSRQ